MSNPRSLAVKGQEVTLQIRFFDASGDPINADRTPSISIRNIDGEEILAERTRGVSNTDVGLYEYIYTFLTTPNCQSQFLFDNYFIS